MNIIEKLDRFIVEQNDRPYVYFFTDKITNMVSKELEKSFDASVDNQMRKTIISSFDKSFVQMSKNFKQLKHYKKLELELEIMKSKGLLEFNYILVFKFDLTGPDLDSYTKELDLDLHEPEVGIYAAENPREQVIDYAADNSVDDVKKFVSKFYKNMTGVKIFKDEVDFDALEYNVIMEFTVKVK